MTPHREILRKADEVVERMRASGALDRRAFMRLSTLGIGATILSACNSAGPKGAQSLLNFAARQNEKFERWLLGQNTPAHIGSLTPAGPRFPAYWVSDTVPMWDDAVRGAWSLEISGAVKAPRTFSYDDLKAMKMETQRVPHYCVEG